MLTGVTLAHYRLIDKIGEGGSGEVWRALDTRLEREVAVKFLRAPLAGDAERLERFQREARALAALAHPNIVVVHSVEEDAGVHFLTMELVRGRTLDEVLPEGGLPIDRWYDLALPIVDAVAAAHERGIVHGDLKPQNIVLGEDGRPRVLDFGLAHARVETAVAVPAEGPTRTLERPTAISGTPAYMAPERIQGAGRDARSDLFSLGVVLYEMATGVRPFRGGTVAELLASILRDAPVPAEALRADLPRRLGRTVAACLDKDPARRPRSAAELRATLLETRGDAHVPGEKEEVPSIAILPPADMSPNRDQDWFCEGLADEIINAIGRVRSLRVASRTSAFQFRNTSLDSREIADRLGVRHLLEGSVRKDGERLRITARLVSAETGYPLWSESFDRRVKDVFAIQDEIAQAIVDALQVTLSPKERRMIRQVATADVQAYEHYLRGRQFYYQYGRRGMEFALEMFSRAIAKDPSYALAWAGIADCRSFLYQNADHSESNRKLAEEASAKALDLDPDLAEAHAARAVALTLFDRHLEAEQHFLAATRIDPRLFEAWYFAARHAFALGKLERAAELYETAAAVRPDDYQALLLVAQIYDDLERPQEAAGARRRGIARAEARLELNPDDARALYMAANGLVVLGEREKALAWAQRALRAEPQEPMLLYNLACIYALAGEIEPAVEFLERSVADGLANRSWIEQDSNLDALRGHPRFDRLVRSLS
ncbi:MAG TPA: protein kinase [Candidatus Polarisedimenticolaceae bacterium]|nr:protein kinase [Candidatus Polarisedimenticolaceae bacterium]